MSEPSAPLPDPRAIDAAQVLADKWAQDPSGPPYCRSELAKWISAAYAADAGLQDLRAENETMLRETKEMFEANVGLAHQVADLQRQVAQLKGAIRDMLEYIGTVGGDSREAWVAYKRARDLTAEPK